MTKPPPRHIALGLAVIALLSACAASIRPTGATAQAEGGSGPPASGCAGFGGVDGPVCRVPLDALAIDPAKHDGKVVKTVGWMAYGPPWLVFASKEAYLASDLSRAVLVREPFTSASALPVSELDQRYIGIVATFNRTGLDWGGERTAGEFTEVVAVGVRTAPWGQRAEPPNPRPAQ